MDKLVLNALEESGLLLDCIMARILSPHNLRTGLRILVNLGDRSSVILCKLRSDYRRLLRVQIRVL